MNHLSLACFAIAAVVYSQAALTAPCCLPLPTDAVAHYPFDANAEDASGNQFHGQGFGGVGYASGLGPGQALLLDGVNDHVELPVSVSGSFSVALWLNTMAQAPSGSAWFEGLGIVDGEVCGSPPGGDWGIALLSGGAVSFADGITVDSVNDGAWHAVILTRNMTLGVFSLFIDGRLSASGFGGTAPLTGLPFIGVGNNPCDISFGRRYFSGRVDHLRLFDRVLTADEIRALSTSAIFADSFE